MITQSRIKRLLRYVQATGLFWWRKNTAMPKRIRGTYRTRPAGTIGTNRHRYISIDGTKYLASRLAYLYVKGQWPPSEIDHENMNPSDDRWKNLRLATHSLNMANALFVTTNKLKGTSWSKEKRKWRANITVNYKMIYLGEYFTQKEAHSAYIKAAKKYFGKFARTH